MNEQQPQYIFEVINDGFAFAPVAPLQRRANHHTGVAFRSWLEEHGKPGKQYQVLAVCSPRSGVEVNTQQFMRNGKRS